MDPKLAALGLILAVHLVAIAVLVWAILDGAPVGWRGWWPRDDDPGEPTSPPRGAPGGDGLPLPGAEPAGVRLRTEHERLTDRRRRVRRPVREPEPAPAREPA